jgi:hypothetical protein
MIFKKINARSYISSGDTILLAYFPDTKNIFYCGIHKGEISGKNIVVESFTSIDDLIERVKNLELNLSNEQATEIIKRDKLKSVNVTETIKTKILEYLKKLKIQDGKINV